MTEQEASQKLESLVGVDRAFRLMRHWMDSVQTAAGNRFTLSPHKQVNQLDSFRRRANNDGYSEAAITCYIQEIQGMH